MVAIQIKKALEELAVACETICGAGRCKMCPLKDICFDDYSIVDIAAKSDSVAISRMTCLADIITDETEEAEKTELERKWEAEADKWNDRRCDPDGE